MLRHLLPMLKVCILLHLGTCAAAVQGGADGDIAMSASAHVTVGPASAAPTQVNLW
jgi:hypothetical protein